MSTGAKVGNQHRQDQGFNLKQLPPQSPMPVPNFQGSAGQPDNQSTDRPKGKT